MQLYVAQHYHYVVRYTRPFTRVKDARVTFDSYSMRNSFHKIEHIVRQSQGEREMKIGKEKEKMARRNSRQ